MKPIFAAALVALAVSSPARAGEQSMSGGKSQTYLVTTTHTPEQCLAALDELAAKDAKMLDRMEWGCKAGDHTGYAFVQAADEKAALAKLPPRNRESAKATPMTKFTPSQLKKIHASMQQK